MAPDHSLLQVRNLGKCFQGIDALKAICLNVGRGQVCALTGENGAGKSTLGKVLSGLYPPDSGTISWKGIPVRLNHPQEALRLGIAMIHQELLCFPELTVAENICMGREPVRGRTGWIDRPAMNRTARHALESMGTDLYPERKMKELCVAERQIVAIARALAHRAEMIVMDEPTSAISRRETELLLQRIADLKARGITVLYISHKLEEIFSIADTITVLRDGRHISTRPAADWDENGLITAMVGREVHRSRPGPFTRKGSPVLEVHRLTRPDKFHEISFTLYRGEILGITGLMGAGRTDLLQTLFGMEPALSGHLSIHGTKTRFRSPREAMAAGMVLVSEDRKEYGLVPAMSVHENLTLSALARCCRHGWIDSGREKEMAERQIRQFSIKSRDPRQMVQYLSGGNQQKVVIARALLTQPSILLLDEPTRGIDIGAKAELYHMITGLAAEGTAILLVSSELPEILQVSTRILVMCRGEIRAELDPQTATQEEILKHAMPQ